MDYNNYKLFKWNHEYIGYSNKTNLYKDVYFNYPKIILSKVVLTQNAL